MAEIQRVGEASCVVSMDLTQIFNAHPIERMRVYANTLIRLGVEDKDTDIMLEKNPAEY